MGEPVLEDLRIVNTRAEHQAAELTTLLESYGANVLHYPAISIRVLDNPAFEEAIKAAVDGAFDWMVVTSGNTVRALKVTMSDLGYEPTALDSLKVATIGPSTEAAVKQELGLTVNFTPPEFVAESLGETLDVAPGQKIFLPQSAIARPTLAETLRRRGTEVTVVDAYYTATGRGGVSLPEYFWRGEVDVVTFTSASTVHRFIRRLKQENGTPEMLVDVIVSCIGPVTAAAARAHELPVRVVAAEHTLDGLVQSLLSYYG